ncbi:MULTISPECIES: glutaminase A [unclassified Paenibacillus]|uniref:glutaminase A n=1 Tax=unclassified Paenibacillus TaxID=185978 RepID=UPI001AE85C27|nr:MULTISPECIES: glutaminase A [unclassified Paenibacillus]MBP1156695.1 glutaminase [Paenibacillus sp. PvP091]MBP1172567.1 glutaminase [Paenibacillus sp. PvR098]MBP2438947.1 glutaminase [Paenibacillus sp. PvP052]
MTNESELNRLTLRLPEWLESSRSETSQGQPASYIPELALAPADALGITIIDSGGREVTAGDCGLRFTMQSISKVFTLLLALIDRGEEGVFSKVGMEPTGDDFNSMLKLELVEPGKPFNPLINAGAIAISSLIHGATPAEKTERILAFFRELAGDATLTYNEAVYRSESSTAHRNRSLAYFLKDNEVLSEADDVEEILDVYFKHCSIELTCRHVARMGLVLAMNGTDPLTGRQLIPRRYVQIAKTFMFSCGMYNASGEFAIRVGLPAKSGVSGGIMALVPGRYGIGVIGPALNDKGNSTAGVHLLQTLSEQFDWSIF